MFASQGMRTIAIRGALPSRGGIRNFVAKNSAPALGKKVAVATGAAQAEKFTEASRVASRRFPCAWARTHAASSVKAQAPTAQAQAQPPKPAPQELGLWPFGGRFRVGN